MTGSSSGYPYKKNYCCEVFKTLRESEDIVKRGPDRKYYRVLKDIPAGAPEVEKIVYEPINYCYNCGMKMSNVSL